MDTLSPRNRGIYQGRALTDLEAAWLAGLLEGEGSFVWRPHRNCVGISIAISIEMTDEDVIRRAALLMENCRVSGQPIRKNGLGTKPFLRAQVGGYAAARIMRQVLPYMGARRSEKIKDCLRRWDERPNKRREAHLPAECHPERKHYSLGLCKRCHYAKYGYSKNIGMNPRLTKRLAGMQFIPAPDCDALLCLEPT